MRDLVNIIRYPAHMLLAFKSMISTLRPFFAGLLFISLSSPTQALEDKRDICVREQYKQYLDRLLQAKPNSTSSLENQTKYWLALAKIYAEGEFYLAEDIQRSSVYEKCENRALGSQDFIILAPTDFMKRSFSDPRLALYYYKKAHNAGSPDGSIGLSYISMRGRGVPKNLSEALSLALVAAKKGSAEGQFIAGVLYAGYDGEAYFGDVGMKGGLMPNLVLSYLWLNISVGSGHGNAGDWRKDVEKKMSGSEINRAQKLSTACSNSRFKNCADGSLLDFFNSLLSK
jgi:hypothetical protein